MSLSPASGIGKFYRHSAKTIRFARHGCTNREFFHIVVMEVRDHSLKFYITPNERSTSQQH